MSRRTEKDMSAVRRTVPFEKALKGDLRKADLKNYKYNGSTVSLTWNMNKQATRDHIFALKIDDKEVYLDLEELLSYTRLM